MFLVVLARRRKLSIQKWKAKLNAQDIQPRIILYDATLYEALTNEYECHWPQKYSSKLRNLMKKTTSMEQFVEENVSEIKNLSKLS